MFNIGDRVVVLKSALDIYNDKIGTVCGVKDDFVEVVLDINKGMIINKTLFFKDNIELYKDPLHKQAEEASKSIKTIVSQMTSIDDRMDNLEIILSKYGLSVKDGCGFMYIYDFLDELGSVWDTISKEDKDKISFCLIGEKTKKV